MREFLAKLVRGHNNAICCLAKKLTSFTYRRLWNRTTGTEETTQGCGCRCEPINQNTYWAMTEEAIVRRNQDRLDLTRGLAESLGHTFLPVDHLQ